MSKRTDRSSDLLVTLREATRADDRAGTGATFMRGLTLGALIGAAVAGSAIWQRRARRAGRVSLDGGDAGQRDPSEAPRQLGP